MNPEPQVVARVEQVGPEAAAAMLKQARPNRNVQDARVARWAEAMRRGEWRLTGEPIQIDSEGYLINGEHRLKAIVLSGETVPLLVVVGVAPEAQSVIDTGKARNLSDVLQLRGEANATALAGALKRVWAYEEIGIPQTESTNLNLGPTTRQTLDVLERHPAVRDTVAESKGKGQKRAALGPAIYGSVRYLTGLADQEDSEEFFGRLTDGAGLEPGSPILVLRERLLASAINPTQRLRPLVKARFLVRTWNAHVSGESMQKLQYGGGLTIANFPRIAGCPIIPKVDQ